jgi:putative spermidine/putrescine transport system substrate-binding protein
MTGSKRNMIGRRALLGAAAVMGCPAIVRAQSKTIVSTGFGGIYEQRYRRHVLEPFEKKTGAKFVFKYGSPDEWLANAVINKDDPEIDLPFLGLPTSIKAARIPGVFLDLTPEMIPNLRDVDPAFYDFFDRKAVGFNYADVGIAYRRDMVAEAPTAWADLWHPRFKGQIIMPQPSGGFFYEMVTIAALLNGGSAANLEPGYAALQRLKPNVVRWYKTPNDVGTMLERKEAAVAMSGSFRTFAMKDAGLPVEFVMPKEGSPVGILSYHVPAKARNRDLLLEFINFALSLEAQTGFGNDMQSGMCNRNVVFRPEIAARIAPQDRLMRLDWKTVEPKMGEMVERVQREVFRD